MTHQDRFDDAMFDYSTGDFDTALAKFMSILEEDPEHLDAQLSVAMCHYRKGDFQAAIVQGHKAESLNPKDQHVHTNLSLFYVKIGDKQKAEHHATQAKVASWRTALAEPPTS